MPTPYASRHACSRTDAGGLGEGVVETRLFLNHSTRMSGILPTHGPRAFG
jgi:hypothetical protein